MEECADAFVQAISKRQRRLFVPKGLSRFWRVRWLLHGPWFDRLIARRAGQLIPRMEAEVRALGRDFGGESVALESKAEPRRRNAAG